MTLKSTNPRALSSFVNLLMQMVVCGKKWKHLFFYIKSVQKFKMTNITYVKRKHMYTYMSAYEEMYSYNRLFIHNRDFILSGPFPSQQYVNHELPDVQAGFRKGRGTRDQIANIRWIIEKARDSRKTSTSALLNIPKPLTVWITTNCGKFFKRWEYQTTWPASWEICMQVRKQQLEPDREQQTVSKLGKEYIKPVYCHPAYLA